MPKLHAFPRCSHKVLCFCKLLVYGGGAQLLCHVQLFATPWTVARQAPLSMGFSRHEYRSRLPFSPPGDLPNPGIEPVPLVSPKLAGRFFTTLTPGKPGLLTYMYESESLSAVSDFL